MPQAVAPMAQQPVCRWPRRFELLPQLSLSFTPTQVKVLWLPPSRPRTAHTCASVSAVSFCCFTRRLSVLMPRMHRYAA